MQHKKQRVFFKYWQGKYFLFFRIHSLQQKGLTVQLSIQYLLPTTNRKSYRKAVILTKCWCHLLWAGEVAGIFPLAALFPLRYCEEPTVVGFFLFFFWEVTPYKLIVIMFYPPRWVASWPFLLFPSPAARGWEEQAPARPRLTRPRPIWLVTVSTAVKVCFNIVGIY